MISCLETHKRFIPRVRPHMNIQMRLLRKTFPTMRQGTSIFALLPRPRQRILTNGTNTTHRRCCRCRRRRRRRRPHVHDAIPRVGGRVRSCRRRRKNIPTIPTRQLLQRRQRLRSLDGRGSLGARLGLNGFHEDVNFGGEVGLVGFLLRA